MRGLLTTGWFFGVLPHASQSLIESGKLATWANVSPSSTFRTSSRMGLFLASRLSAFTFLTPLFGVASGHFVLGEPISWAFGVAVALVIAGLVLVNRPN